MSAFPRGGSGPPSGEKGVTAARLNRAIPTASLGLVTYVNLCLLGKRVRFTSAAYEIGIPSSWKRTLLFITKGRVGKGAPTLGNMMLPEGTQGPTSSSASAGDPMSLDRTSGDPMSLDRTSGDPMSVSYEQPRSAGNPPKESVASNPIEGGRASSSKTRRHIEDEVMKSLTDLLDREGEKSDISRDAISDILKLHKRTEPELHAVLSHLHYEGVRSPWYRETLERQRVLETLSEDEDA
ncbi:hypothetical protein AAG906_019348 [Vitis piasezkii]